jgi:C1A family cysteine protease
MNNQNLNFGTKSIQHVYGWKPDLPDHRDYLYEVKEGITLPKIVDLRSGCSPVEDQGQLGSCTANALVGALEFLEVLEKLPFADLSRLFVYYDERAIEGTISQDSGAQIRDGVKVLASQGVCPEAEWPYNVAKFKNKPTAQCYADALKHKIAQYQRLNTLVDMQNCLASGFPFVFGFTVYSSFESSQVAQTGIVNLPAKHEQVLGGHAVMAVGYNETQQRFIVRNSWGIAWGQKGYFTIPFAYLENSNLSSDFWMITR